MAEAGALESSTLKVFGDLLDNPTSRAFDAGAMRCRVLGTWLICLALLLFARTSSAEAPTKTQKSAVGSAEAERHRAYEHLKSQGNEAIQGRRFDEALRLYLAAWESFSKDGSLACDIGRTYTVRGDYVGAATWLTRCVNLLSDASSQDAVQERRNEAVDLAVASARVSTLHLDTEPGASLSVDGVNIGTSPQGEPAFVTPGKHTLEARKGSKHVSVSIESKAGEVRRIPLTLLPTEPTSFKKPQPEQPPHPAVPPMRPDQFAGFVWWPVLVGGALTTVGVTSGTLLRITADNADSERAAVDQVILAESPGVACGDRKTAHPRCPERVQLDAQYASYATASNVVFIITGAAAVATISFAAYEAHRVKVAPTLGGLVASYQW